MLIPFIALAAGIFFATNCGADSPVGLTSVLGACSLYYYLIGLKRNPVIAYRVAPYHYIWIFLCFLGIGIIRGDIARNEPPDFHFLRCHQAAEAKVLSISNKTSGDRIVAEVSRLYSKEHPIEETRFKIIVRSTAAMCEVGDYILFPINHIQRIESSKNSFRTDYVESLHSQNIYYEIQLPGESIQKIDYPFSLSGLSIRIRDKFVSFIENTPLKRETKGFLIPLLTGDRGYLDDNTRNIFSDAGVSHILALSGLHIGIIAAIFLSIFFPLNFIGRYKLRFFLTALLLWIYAFITGMSPSIMRACVMYSAFILAILIERKNSGLNSLSLAGFLILLTDPEAIFNVGFQLSFLCVGALIIFSPYLNPIERRYHPRLYYLTGLISASLIATFASWIVIAHQFNTVPLLFLPANILILPLLPFYVVLVLIYFLFHSLGYTIPLSIEVIDGMYEGLIKLLSLLGADTTLNLEVPNLSVLLWIIGLISAGIYFIYRRKPIILASGIFLFALSIYTIYSSTSTRPHGIIIRNSARNIGYCFFECV